MKKKIKICHIVPSNFGGGVESAAKSFISYSSDNFVFKVYFIKTSEKQNSLLSIFKSLQYLFRNNPDIILISLWKSSLLALIYKFFNKNVKLILFFHSTKNIHLIDSFATNLTALLSFEIWADSNTTMSERINNLYFFKFYEKLILNNKKKRIISFVKEKIPPLPEKSCKSTFIYWGRLCPNKNIDKAIRLFSKIHALEPNSKFIIIGPDNGVKELLQSIVTKMNLVDNVFIYDFMNFDEIKKYAKKSSFFIQLSSFEGMAMSVSESMQLGLIPIVTNVGQIKIYCQNYFNSLIFDKNEEEIIKNIFKLISSRSYYKKMRENSINTWVNSSTYKTDLAKNFEEISNYF